MATIKDMLFAGKSGGGGITPTGTLNITENGTYNVTNYASAEVEVPSSGGTFNVVIKGVYATDADGNPLDPTMLTRMGIILYSGTGASLANTIGYIPSWTIPQAAGEEVNTQGAFTASDKGFGDISKVSGFYVPDDPSQAWEAFFWLDYIDVPNNTIYVTFNATFN